jgi:hypothetical protein
MIADSQMNEEHWLGREGREDVDGRDERNDLPPEEKRETAAGKI